MTPTGIWSTPTRSASRRPTRSSSPRTWPTSTATGGEIVATVGSTQSISYRGIALFDAASGELLSYHDQSSVASNVSIGDIYHDGYKEMVYGGWGQWTGQDGWDGLRDDSSYVWCLDASGTSIWRDGPLYSGPDKYGRQYSSSTGAWKWGVALRQPGR